MTGIEAILDSVAAEAQTRAAAILKEAKDEAAARLNQAKAEAAALEQQGEEAAQAAAEDRKRRGESAARRKARELLLEKKQAMIDRALALAYQRLVTMPDEAYTQFVLGRLESLPPETQGTLRFAPRPGGAVPDALAAALAEKHPGLTLDTAPLRAEGGFLLSVGQIEENYTFQALLDENAELLRDKANSLLFEEGAQ